MILKYVYYSLTSALILISSLASGHEHAETNLLTCIDSEKVDDTTDLFPHKVEALHSDHWNITYHNTYKVIENKAIGVSYLLYQCGTTPPANTDDYQFAVPVPLQDGIALTQTTYIPHVELLGKRAEIGAYIGSPAFISSPCLNELINDELLPVIDAFNSTAVDDWLAKHPNSVIASNPWTDSSLPNRFIISESSETASNKAVFEWHKVFSAFYNLEHLGNKNFDETSARYDCNSENAALIEADKEKPKVLWAYWIDYYDSWSNTTTTGWSLGSCPNYYCEFAEHCAADFMLPEQFDMEGSVDCWGSKCMNDMEFKDFAIHADYWIFPAADFNSVYGQKKEMMDQIPAVQSQEVYDTYGSGPNTWFEQRMAEYDVVLQDMCEVIGTSPPGSPHKRKWFRNVFTEPLGELGHCVDVNAPLQTQATECAVAAATATVDLVEETSSASMRSGAMVGIVSLAIAMLF